MINHAYLKGITFVWHTNLRNTYDKYSCTRRKYLTQKTGIVLYLFALRGQLYIASKNMVRYKYVAKIIFWFFCFKFHFNFVCFKCFILIFYILNLHLISHFLSKLLVPLTKQYLIVLMLTWYIDYTQTKVMLSVNSLKVVNNFDRKGLK